jgi:peptidoglycan/xylan/chitin deacetylase (PgdA/CDA1 family)
MRAVLTYHSIDSSGSPISVGAATFQSHLRWLAGSGVQVVTLERLLELPAEADAVAITFDDGFANFASAAWPSLREYGFPVTLFVVSDFVGRSNSWGRFRGVSIPDLPLLDWKTLVQLAEEGVRLGSHSRTHPDLRAVSESELREEIEGSASSILAETGHVPASFAYPYGFWDADVVAAVRETYRTACSTELRPLAAQTDAWCLPRLDAFYVRRAGCLESWGTARFQRHLWFRSGVRRVRNTLRPPVLSP